ncbi:MAG: MarR family winged helix-turn-helix transcriptional regulator [Acidobacteriota bacterium]
MTRARSRQTEHSNAEKPATGASRRDGKVHVPLSRAEQTFLALVRTASTLSAHLADLFKEFGLTPAQYNVLRILRGAGPDGLLCSQVSERMITRDSDITRLLDRLETAGWVARERHSRDRRAVVTRITPDGLRLLAKLDGPLAAHHSRTFASLADRDVETLHRLLDAVGGG